MARTLSCDEARRFYDRFGSRQDQQAWYEDAPLEELMLQANFEEARSVVEFGTGTGRLAATLLERHLPAGATYLGFDLSHTMVELARGRLAPWNDRAEVRLTDGAMTLTVPDAKFDRFLSTYVLDLLSASNIECLLREAHRVLNREGRLCITGLTDGPTVASRGVSLAWKAIHRLRPALVGGCRPMCIADRLNPEQWRIEHRSVKIARCLASEVLCAVKR